MTDGEGAMAGATGAAGALAAIRARWAKATPGPWKYTSSLILTSAKGVADNGIAVMYDPRYEDDLPNAKANGKAIAAAPDDIAALLALADEAIDLREQIRLSRFEREQAEGYAALLEADRAEAILRAAKAEYYRDGFDALGGDWDDAAPELREEYTDRARAWLFGEGDDDDE